MNRYAIRNHANSEEVALSYDTLFVSFRRIFPVVTILHGGEQPA
jgi:hypothetical protein